ncbi:MAG TPA: SpoIIE family protein phosphatase [Candidatus Koribacter sp.]
MFVFTLEALYANIAGPLGHPVPNVLGHLGFAVLLIGFGHSALQMVGQREQRLRAIESELEVAREIQNAILPKDVPHLEGVDVAATYQPMTEVAGDFYEFLPVDDQHAGFLVADVCGHGVPAALIASMLKVAVQSVAASASDPGKLLAELNRALWGPLRGKLVSAAYLWLDMEEQRALYSAAGHPPLLHKNHDVQAIESNGLLFGVMAGAQYPVKEIRLSHGDRLLMYTDGASDPENAAGDSFGETKLSALLKEKVPAAELSERITAELHRWQVSPQSAKTALLGDPGPEQQDDITLIVMDVL